MSTKFTQNDQDHLARLICDQHIAFVDKESLACALVREYEFVRGMRFIRLATIPNYDEDLTEDSFDGDF